jgi:hypothetical protein
MGSVPIKDLPCLKTKKELKHTRNGRIMIKEAQTQRARRERHTSDIYFQREWSSMEQRLRLALLQSLRE